MIGQVWQGNGHCGKWGEKISWESLKEQWPFGEVGRKDWLDKFERANRLLVKWGENIGWTSLKEQWPLGKVGRKDQLDKFERAMGALGEVERSSIGEV